MTRNTEILCPDCFKGRIHTEDGVLGSCNKCDTKFTLLGDNRVKYYEGMKSRHNSINSFTDRELHRISPDTMEEYRGFKQVDYKDKEYDDPKYNWIMCIRDDARDTKYGRTMVSVEYKLKRGQTMGEFYGTSLVD